MIPKPCTSLVCSWVNVLTYLKFWKQRSNRGRFVLITSHAFDWTAYPDHALCFDKTFLRRVLFFWRLVHLIPFEVLFTGMKPLFATTYIQYKFWLPEGNNPDKKVRFLCNCLVKKRWTQSYPANPFFYLSTSFSLRKDIFFFLPKRYKHIFSLNFIVSVYFNNVAFHNA